MKIFITGGTGFIGSHLINALHTLGHDVISLKRSKSKPRISLKKQPQWIIGKLGDGTLTKLPNSDIVIHLAASGVKASNRNWNNCINSNIIGTNELLYGLSNVSNTPLLIYPRTFYEDYLNKFTKLKNNPYFVTKAAATKMVELWVKTNQKSRVNFGTIFQAYGPGDDLGNVLSYTAGCLGRDIPAKLGNGEILRDWIYIDDLVDVLIKSIKCNNNRIQYFDFGTGKLTSLREMVEMLASLMDSSKNLLHFDSKKDRGDIKIDACAINQIPEWVPNYLVKSGIKEFIKHI